MLIFLEVSLKFLLGADVVMIAVCEVSEINQCKLLFRFAYLTLNFISMLETGQWNIEKQMTPLVRCLWFLGVDLLILETSFFQPMTLLILHLKHYVVSPMTYSLSRATQVSSTSAWLSLNSWLDTMFLKCFVNLPPILVKTPVCPGLSTVLLLICRYSLYKKVFMVHYLFCTDL